MRTLTNKARHLLPSRRVRRSVQGVSLLLPWSHRLPDYAETYPAYGQNLVAVAQVIGGVDSTTRFSVIDVGANVGDSALQILNVVDADVVCVEGDTYWLPFLRANSANESRIHIVHSMLQPTAHLRSQDFHAYRAAGTTRFIPGGGSNSVPTKTPEMLRAVLRGLAPTRLIKSDVDGFDVRLLPGLAHAYSDTRPVLFFEFDPHMSRETGDPEPERVWGELGALGYDHCVVWDNFGQLLGSWPIAELPEAATALEKPFSERGYHYWDVAVIQSDDPYGYAVEQAFQK